jgi:hypothetical protein
MDALVILAAAKAPSRALLAASIGVLGSPIGNLALFLAPAARGLTGIIEERANGNSPAR